MRWARTLYLGHQWLGMAAGGVLLVVALSGAILTVAPEVRKWAYRQNVAAEAGEFASVAAFRDTLQREFPEGDFRTINFRGRERTVEVLLFAPGTYYLAQLNPYSAELVHLQNMKQGFMQRVLGLHRNLLWEDPGRQIVHWATLIFFGLLVSGIVMKRGRKRWQGLAGWHVLVGYYGSVVALASIGTGLYWGFSPIKETVKWFTGETTRHYELPESVLPEGLETPKRGPGAWEMVDRLAVGFRQRFPEQWVRVSVPHLEQDPVRVAVIQPPGGEVPADLRYFDRYTGEELEGRFEHKLAEEANVFQVINRWVYAIHFGTWGGWWGRGMMGLSALAVASLVVSGWGVFWRRWRGRRPRSIR